MESAARERALQISSRALETWFNNDLSDYKGPKTPCSCGNQAHYRGRRSKIITTLTGEIELERAYYHCRRCQSGFYPRDQHLGLKDSLSPGTQRVVCHLAAREAFESCQTTLKLLSTLEVDAKLIERAAKCVGAQMDMWQSQDIPRHHPPEQIPLLYIQLDGTGIPMHGKELQGRKGKQADGSAKTREVKVGCVFTQTSTTDEGKPIRDPGSTTYVGAIESAEDFGRRLSREAQRRGHQYARKVVVVSDGAVWIRHLKEAHFRDAIHIIDIYHAREKLHEASKLIWGCSPAASQWAEERIEELDEGQIDRIVAKIRLHANSGQLDRDHALSLIAEYFDKNRERMDYPSFRRQGLFVGSGVIESACKTLVGKRCKQSGMHWSVNGANAIIALRATDLSGRENDFWEDRAAA